MTTSLPDRNPAIQCRGLIIHHRDHWWLVEFPHLKRHLQRHRHPARAYLLSGRITTDFAKRAGLDTGPRILLPSVAMLNPDQTCWAGNFELRPTIATAKPDQIDYDINAHVFHGSADELEERLARAMIEITLFPIPMEFTSVFTALPDEDVPVLAIRASGYVCATFELLTARYMPTYRPRSPWRDISNESVFDSGAEVLGWMHAGNWIQPR